MVWLRKPVADHKSLNPNPCPLFLCPAFSAGTRGWGAVTAVGTSLPGGQGLEGRCEHVQKPRHVGGRLQGQSPGISRTQFTSTATDRGCCAFAPTIFCKHPKNTISRKYKITNKRLFRARRNSCRTWHVEVKCRKALWLQAREILWSNCKRTQSSESRFFLCKKYELLLRSLPSNRLCRELSHRLTPQWPRPPPPPPCSKLNQPCPRLARNFLPPSLFQNMKRILYQNACITLCRTGREVLVCFLWNCIQFVGLEIVKIVPKVSPSPKYHDLPDARVVPIMQLVSCLHRLLSKTAELTLPSKWRTCGRRAWVGGHGSQHPTYDILESGLTQLDDRKAQLNIATTHHPTPLLYCHLPWS